MSRLEQNVARLMRTAPVFAALGDEMRLGLVAKLGARGPQSITELTAGTHVTRQAVTKHLAVLADAGLVRDVRRGRERIWDLDTEKVASLGRYLDQISKRWDQALERLRRHVEE